MFAHDLSPRRTAPSCRHPTKRNSHCSILCILSSCFFDVVQVFSLIPVRMYRTWQLFPLWRSNESCPGASNLKSLIITCSTSNYDERQKLLLSFLALMKTCFSPCALGAGGCLERFKVEKIRNRLSPLSICMREREREREDDFFAFKILETSFQKDWGTKFQCTSWLDALWLSKTFCVEVLREQFTFLTAAALLLT